MASKQGPSKQPLRSPEQLNSVIRLTSASSWILLAVLTVCIGSVLVWSIFGRLLVHVHGPGVLEFTGGQISLVEATATGEIKDILVKVGDSVKAGDTLFKIDQTSVLAERDGVAKTVVQQKLELDTYSRTSDKDIKTRKENLDQQITFLTGYIAKQKDNEAQLKKIYQDNQELANKGLVTQPVLQQSFERLIGVQQDIGDKVSSMADMKLQQVEFEDTVSKNVSELKIQLAESQGRLNQLNAELKFGGAILSPSDGIVSEVAADVGKVVQVGEELGAVQSGAPILNALGYMPIGKGKRVLVGMEAEISPTSIESNIFGSIKGKVIAVSRLPVTEAVLENGLGNRSLAAQLMKQGAPIKVTVELDTDKDTESGLRWTSSEGPPVEITAGTTADVRILTAERRPISLLLPVLQTWTTAQ